MIWIMSFLLTVAFAKAKDKAIQVKMTKTATCKSEAAPGAVASDKRVLVFKQWHLAPTTITKGFKEKYSQEKNQTAIYKNLSELVKRKQLEIIFAEGCEGEIDGKFETAFNGWKIEDLKKMAQTRGFEKIVAHVPMKVEARWGDKVVTLCGDDEQQIKKKSAPP